MRSDKVSLASVASAKKVLFCGSPAKITGKYPEGPIIVGLAISAQKSPSTPSSDRACGFLLADKRIANRSRSASESASLTSEMPARCDSRQAGGVNPRRRLPDAGELLW